MHGKQKASARRIATIIVVGSLSVGGISTAYSKSPESMACDGSEPQYSLDQQIAGCTALIAQNPDNPNNYSAFNNRCETYWEKRQYDLAIADCNRSIQLKPDFSEAFNNRGLAYSGKGQYDQAIADYQQALKLNTNVKNAAVNLRKAQEAKAKAAAN